MCAQIGLPFNNHWPTTSQLEAIENVLCTLPTHYHRYRCATAHPSGIRILQHVWPEPPADFAA
eukprot:1984885-Pleurochrysis_carterae.AAC.1